MTKFINGLKHLSYETRGYFAITLMRFSLHLNSRVHVEACVEMARTAQTYSLAEMYDLTQAPDESFQDFQDRVEYIANLKVTGMPLEQAILRQYEDRQAQPQWQWQRTPPPPEAHGRRRRQP